MNVLLKPLYDDLLIFLTEELHQFHSYKKIEDNKTVYKIQYYSENVGQNYVQCDNNELIKALYPFFCGSQNMRLELYSKHMELPIELVDSFFSQDLKLLASDDFKNIYENYLYNFGPGKNIYILLDRDTPSNNNFSLVKNLLFYDSHWDIFSYEDKYSYIYDLLEAFLDYKSFIKNNYSHKEKKTALLFQVEQMYKSLSAVNDKLSDNDIYKNDYNIWNLIRKNFTKNEDLLEFSQYFLSFPKKKDKDSQNIQCKVTPYITKNLTFYYQDLLSNCYNLYSKHEAESMLKNITKILNAHDFENVYDIKIMLEDNSSITLNVSSKNGNEPDVNLLTKVLCKMIAHYDEHYNTQLDNEHWQKYINCVKMDLILHNNSSKKSKYKL